MFSYFVPFVVLQDVYFWDNVFIYDCTWHKWLFALSYVLGLYYEWVLKFRSRFCLIHHNCTVVIILDIICYLKIVFFAVFLRDKRTFKMVVFKACFWSYIILCNHYSSCQNVLIFVVIHCTLILIFVFSKFTLILFIYVIHILFYNFFFHFKITLVKVGSLKKIFIINLWSNFFIMINIKLLWPLRNLIEYNSIIMIGLIEIHKTGRCFSLWILILNI